jgi:hypothetical protein
MKVEDLVYTLKVCKEYLPPDTHPTHFERLREIEGLITREPNRTSKKVKPAQNEQIKQYLEDIKDIGKEMEKTDQPEVRGMQLESIQFRAKMIRGLLD